MIGIVVICGVTAELGRLSVSQVVLDGEDMSLPKAQKEQGKFTSRIMRRIKVIKKEKTTMGINKAGPTLIRSDY